MSKDKDLPKGKRESIYDEKRTPLDEMEEEQFVDDVPMEDLKIDEYKNRGGAGYQKTSQTERKYEQPDNKKKDKKND